MELWAYERPWAGRRLAAVSYALNSNGSPHPAGRDWAARPVDFFALNPLILSICRGMHVPIPAIADAEKQKEHHAKDESTESEMQDMRENMSIRTATRNPPLGSLATPRKEPLHLDTLVPEIPAHSRLDKHTHEPVHHSSKNNPEATPINDVHQLNQWTSEGTGRVTS